MYAQGVDLWLAPTLAIGDGWIATLRHLARENRMFVVGVNPVLHADEIPAAFPHREQLVPPGYLEENGPWLEEGNTVIIAPDGSILAGPVRERKKGRSSPRSTSALSCPHAATWTQRATMTAPVSSGSMSTPRRGRPSSRPRTTKSPARHVAAGR
jgi:hypothetical protein